MRNDSFRRNLVLAPVLFAALTLASSAHANVYATDIRLNGGLTNAGLATGESVTISYILNEPASRSVTLSLLSGSTPVRTLNLAPDSSGTLRGTNSVVWDGRTDAGAPVPAGLYSVSIRASSTGYSSWTQITDDSNIGNYVWEGRGIAVNRDTNSVYFGRVYVANSAPGPGSYPGDEPGILMLNADGSPAEEGVFSTGGYSWAANTLSPWHLEVSDDDYVYINDWSGNGEIHRWDALLSPPSRVDVLRQTNWGNGGIVNLSGPALSGTGTNTILWMADYSPGGLGLIKYNITNTDGALADGDTGVTVVSNTPDLSLMPYDVAADKDLNLYTIQFAADGADPSPRVLRFLASDPSKPAWAIGAQDPTMGRATGVAVDPMGTFVAVSFRGIDDPQAPGQWTNGCTQIFYATNGALVARLDLGQPGKGGNKWHEDTDCTWDAAGNVYCIDNVQTVWRAYSPPGANESTTLSIQKIEVTGSVVEEPPRITKIDITNGMVIVTFTGSASDPPSAYTLLGASSPAGPYLPEANYTMNMGSVPGEFRATVPLSGGVRFYRVTKAGSPPVNTVLINSITVVNGTVTIEFTGSPSDTAASYQLLAASSPAGPFVAEPNSSISPGSTAGTFKATVAASAPLRFFRVVRSGSVTQAAFIKGIEVAAGTVTVKFLGNPGDAPSAYTLVAASAAQGSFAPETNCVITAEAMAGEFRASAPMNGPNRFYRVLR